MIQRPKDHVRSNSLDGIARAILLCLLVMTYLLTMVTPQLKAERRANQAILHAMEEAAKEQDPWKSFLLLRNARAAAYDESKLCERRSDILVPNCVELEADKAFYEESQKYLQAAIESKSIPDGVQISMANSEEPRRSDEIQVMK